MLCIYILYSVYIIYIYMYTFYMFGPPIVVPHDLIAKWHSAEDLERTSAPGDPLPESSRRF